MSTSFENKRRRPGTYQHYCDWISKHFQTSFILEGQDLEDFWDYVQNTLNYEREIQGRFDNQLSSERSLKLRFVYDLRIRRNLRFD